MGNFFDKYQSIQGLSTLYNTYDPAFDNLFFIEVYTLTGEDKDISDYAKFHASKVSFNGESIGFERHGVSKKFFLKSNAYERSNDLSIDWMEDKDWSVKRYHENWIKRFYDKENDCYISYGNNDGDIPSSARNFDAMNDTFVGNTNLSDTSDKDVLYRVFKVYFPKAFNTEEYLGIEFNHVLPNTSGDFNFQWKTKGGIVSHSLKYFVTDWKWIKG